MVSITFPDRAKKPAAITFPERTASGADPSKMTPEEQAAYRERSYQEQAAKGVRPEDMVDPFGSGVPGSMQSGPYVPPKTKITTDPVQDIAHEAIMAPLSGLAKGGFELAALPFTAAEMLTPYAEDDVRYLLGNSLTSEQAAQRKQDYSDYFAPVHKARSFLEENRYHPTSVEGQALELGGEMTVGGGWPSRFTRAATTVGQFGKRYLGDLVGNVAVPAIGSEVAGAISDRASGDPLLGTLARIFGAGAGNVATAFGKAWNAADAINRRSTRNVTPDQWREAQQLFELGRQHGVDLSSPEIMSEVTGGASPLTNVLRVVEGNPITGAEITGPYFARRPGQVQEAADVAFNSISPPSAQPTRLGAQAEQAADEVKRTVMRERGDITEPHYELADPTQLPEQDVRTIAQQLDDIIASDPTGILGEGPLGEMRRRFTNTPAREAVPAVPAQRNPVYDPKTGKLLRYETVPGTPEIPAVPETLNTTIGALDRVKKYYRDIMGLPMANTERAAFVGERGEQAGNIINQLDELMSRDPNYRAGKAAHEQATHDIVEPVTQGPVGKVAQAGGDTTKAAHAILPPNPLADSANELGTAFRQLYDTDPRTALQLLRQNLADRWERAATATQAGVQEFAGAKFAKDIAGNRSKEQAVQAVAGAIPGVGPAVAQTLGDLVRVFRTTGRRQRPGSATEFNRTLSEDLHEGSPGMVASELASTGGISWPARMRDYFKRLAMRENVGTLARMYTDLDNPIGQLMESAARGPQIGIPRAIARTAVQTAPQASQALQLLFGGDDQR